MNEILENNRVEMQLLPFMGFYDSWYSEQVDMEFESYLENISEGYGEGKPLPEGFDMWDVDINYSAIWLDYAKAYVEAFANYVESEFDTKLDLEFAELTSPSYYNFETDKIWVTVPKEQIDKIRKEVEKYPEWPERVIERHRSRSGFTSFHSDDVNDEEWTEDVLNPILYGTVIQTWIEHNARANGTGNPDDFDYIVLNEVEAEIMANIEVYNFDSMADALNLLDAEIEKQRKLEAEKA